MSDLIDLLRPERQWPNPFEQPALRVLTTRMRAERRALIKRCAEKRRS